MCFAQVWTTDEATDSDTAAYPAQEDYLTSLWRQMQSLREERFQDYVLQRYGNGAGE